MDPILKESPKNLDQSKRIIVEHKIGELSSNEILQLFEVFIEFIDETCSDAILQRYRGKFEDKLKDFENKRNLWKIKSENDEKELIEKLERDSNEINRIIRNKLKK